MSDLTFYEFSNAWSTYWGRREIGLVLDNPTAARIASQPRSLHTFYDQWLSALAIFPGDAPLWLMGTPDLTPDLLPTPSEDPVGPPPVPRVGRYVTLTPSVSGLSQLAGDYVVTVPKNSPAARTGRKVARGLPGVFLSVFSLLLVVVPFAALPTAVVGLWLTAQAHWQLRGSRTSRTNTMATHRRGGDCGVGDPARGHPGRDTIFPTRVPPERGQCDDIRRGDADG